MKLDFGSSTTSWAVVCTLLHFSTTSSAFVPKPKFQHKIFAFQNHVDTYTKSNTCLQSTMTPADAISTLAKSQEETVSTIATTIDDLQSKPDASWTAAGGNTVGGKDATLDARDAPGPSNIAWLSNLCIQETLSSLTIFNGPLNYVPHLRSTCRIVSPDTMQFDLDFRPRAYGAYEMKDADGNYPGPDKLGREAFTYSGNRKEYETNFGNEEVQAFLTGLTTDLAGVKTLPAPTEECDTLTRGPFALSITFPITPINIDLLVKARQKAAEYWLSWAKDGDSFAHRPGAPINSQYVYDSKYRINSYTSVLAEYSAAFGQADGAKLAAADSGPLDEAYVGGGS